jgi:putative phosphoesterase
MAGWLLGWEPSNVDAVPRSYVNMRIALVSDIHGNLLALEAVVRDLSRHAPDVTVNLGDCATSPLWPAETVALLESLAWPTVRGNHDRWLGMAGSHDRAPSVQSTRAALPPDVVQRLGALPPRIELDDAVLAVHGTPESDEAYLLEERVEGRLMLVATDVLERRLGSESATLIACGHSHLAHAAVAGGGRLVVNPGSVGMPRYADNPDAERNEAGSPHARYAIATRERAGWSVQFVSLVYDWEQVAARARALNRSDFASAFLRGM